MNLISIFFYIIVTSLFTSDDNSENLSESNIRLNQFVNQPCFRENLGQITDQYSNPRPEILFSGETGCLSYYLTTTGINYQISKPERRTTEVNRLFSWANRKRLKKVQLNIFRVEIKWMGANSDFQIEPGNEVPGYENYYNLPEGLSPVTMVKSYKSVLYKDIYDGIDLKYFINSAGELEYDFIVSPGADYKQICLLIKGAKLRVNDLNSLTLKLPSDYICEGPLRVKQGENEVASSWDVKNNMARFIINGKYDTTQPLYIDPPVRIWGSYYGGEYQDEVSSCVNDNNGNVYIAGETESRNNIATTGAHQTTYGGGSYGEAFLIKFNSDGVRQWGTYYGGSDAEYPANCSIDQNGNIYLTGSTMSLNNIATPGTHKPTKEYGYPDAFLVKFNSEGVRQWGTYYGGYETEYAEYCSTDTEGNVFITGWTRSTNDIATPDAHQVSLGGYADAFLVKFNSDGVRQWGTYFGGNYDDGGYSCSADKSGNVFLTGNTSSTNVNLSTAGSFRTEFSDGFLVKFNSLGAREWCTYFKRSNCCTDYDGNVYLAGTTESSDIITTDGAHQIEYGGGFDAFLVKFNSSGGRLWGTYYGGYFDDLGAACSTDKNGNVYLTGSTKSVNNISTPDAHQTEHGDGIGGNDSDAFLVKFNTEGIRQWGTYYGGSSSDSGTGISIDPDGSIYFAGRTSSSNNIATPGAHQTESIDIYGIYDGFFVKFFETPTNIFDIKTNKYISVFPNPTTNRITITVHQEGIYTIEIFNLNGILLKKDEISFSESTNTDLDLSNCPSGTYIIKIKNNLGLILIKRFIIL
ncbi:MAG TPA: SBBP repeat-containing protein [Bacteroidales bacterium]|nr:SBBP repeat-containing protein [Bacteroidales bacterium]HPR12259.1 SBBP repeat-containing protein [Bacteroidales bacterium]HRW83891.1 SBBP repeat-containing protein [Bacteroidales bacterium]